MASFNKRCAEVLFVVAIVTLMLVSQAAEMNRATMSPVIISGGSADVCPSDEIRQTALDRIRHDIEMFLNNSLRSPINDYCGSGEWHRAAYLNMTDPQQNCPAEWTELTRNTIRGCGRVASCSGKIFATGRQYSKVCGRIIASSTDAFQSGDENIDGVYVDGVSVTYGSPRNHIWTFAGGWSELSHPNSNIYNCPCSDSPSTSPPPSFVGDNYFCESANTDEHYRDNHIYTDDKLWDGEQCSNEGTCCTNKSPPWFSVDIPTSTVDDIEVRICGNEGLTNENTPIELLEIYIQ